MTSQVEFYFLFVFNKNTFKLYIKLFLNLFTSTFKPIIARFQLVKFTIQLNKLSLFPRAIKWESSFCNKLQELNSHFIAREIYEERLFGTEPYNYL